MIAPAFERCTVRTMERFSAEPNPPTLQVLPAELLCLVRGTRQARWLDAMLTPEGLHHADGKRGRYSAGVHRDVATFVSRCRCAGWRVTTRTVRGSIRFLLDSSDYDPERGEAHGILREEWTDELVSELTANAQLRQRSAQLVAAAKATGWWCLSSSECVRFARQLSDPQTEVLVSLMVDGDNTIDELACAALVLAPTG